MSDTGNLAAQCTISFVAAVHGEKGADGKDGTDGRNAEQYALSVTGTRHDGTSTAKASYSLNHGDAVTGFVSGGRGLAVLVFSADGTEVTAARETFDTYGDSDKAASLVAKLKALHGDADKVVAVVSMDAVEITQEVQAELRNFGSDDGFTTGTKSTANCRVAYAFIGQYGMQPGTAYYAHSYDADMTLTASVNAGVLTPRGEKGDGGIAGKGISSADVVFGSGGDGTDAPEDSAFTATLASELTPENNKYLWQAVKVTYTDGTVAYSGKQCLGCWNDITTGIEMYTVSDSGTEAPALPGTEGASWETYATPSKGKYLWSTTQVTFSTDERHYTAPVCIGYYGEDGASVTARYSSDKASWHDTFKDGDVWMRTSSDGGKTWGEAVRIVGEDGADGAWTDYTFCLGASLTDPPTGGTWQDAPLATTEASPYLWMKVQRYSDKTTTDGDASYVRLTGEKGPGGTSVTAQYSASGGDGSWHASFSTGDTWMRLSEDGGASWGGAIRVVGEKGDGGAWTDYRFNISSARETASATDAPTPIGYETWQDAPVATTTAYPYLWMRAQKYSDTDTASGSATYARLTGEKGDKGDKGDPGAQGLDGCILRQSEWAAGVEYHNDESLKSWPRYLDVVVKAAPETTAGYIAWYCASTHTSTADNAPQTTSAGLAADGGSWKAMNSLAPIYTPLIIAKNAVLRFTQANQLLVMKEDGTTVNAAMGGGQWPLWVGGNTYSEAPFAVDRWGNVKSGTSIIPAVNGSNSYIVEDKSGMVFTPSSDTTSTSFSVHLPIDSEYIGRRLTIILQPQSYSSGVYGKSGFTLTITAGDVFVNCVYGQGTGDAPTALIGDIANSDGRTDTDALSGMQYFGGGYTTQGTTDGIPSKITLQNHGHVELLGIAEEVRNVWRAAVGAITENGETAYYKPHITRSDGLIDDGDAENGTIAVLKDGDEYWAKLSDEESKAVKTNNGWTAATQVCRWVIIDHTGAEFS